MDYLAIAERALAERAGGGDPALAADPEPLIAALEGAARALQRAHAAGGEAAIDAAWRRYLRRNGAYVAWSRALRRTDPGGARRMDARVADRLRALAREAER
jgi:hypothetical protein